MSKIHVMTDTVREVAAWALGMTLVGAGLYWLFEGVHPFEALYWSVVSGSSTGYGDYSPKTVPGRILTIVYLIIMLWVITPILTGRIAAYMIVNNDAWTHGEQEQLKADIAAIRQKMGA